jgi:putative FmdB family regulatory protein
MPVYEYACKDCGHKFDSLRLMKDADSPIACKHCQSLQTHRKLSTFFSSSEGRTAGSQGGGCSGCNGGSCASCRN